MNQIALKQSFKKKRVVLIFFVLFSLDISENVFAIKQWNRNYVEVRWDSKYSMVLIKTKIYNYSIGPESKHGYLKWCKFECSDDREHYSTLMEFRTKLQKRSNKTTLSLSNKLENADIHFLQNADFPPVGTTWLESSKMLDVTVNNYRKSAFVHLGWYVGLNFIDIRYIQISGLWDIEAPYSGKSFSNIVYKIKKTSKFVINSNTPGVISNASKNDTVKVFKKSEAIHIKGADLGANIKVYTRSGVEIKSVISNKDVVKIELPEKQIYIVHVGKSRYKVAL